MQAVGSASHVEPDDSKNTDTFENHAPVVPSATLADLSNATLEFLSQEGMEMLDEMGGVVLDQSHLIPGTGISGVVGGITTPSPPPSITSTPTSTSTPISTPTPTSTPPPPSTTPTPTPTPLLSHSLTSSSLDPRLSVAVASQQHPAASVAVNQPAPAGLVGSSSSVAQQQQQHAAAVAAAAAAQQQQGMATAGLAPSTNPQQRQHQLQQQQLFNLKMLETSMENMPEPMDTERPKAYIPQNPYPTPAYFPTVPPPIFENPATFERFDTDTLFFVFYYQQGTYQQYLASRELKNKSWRYHKKYLTWFQRHEEPKEITNDYEQGTYVYFDYEAGWCQRKKTEFTFEYRFLEEGD